MVQLAIPLFLTFILLFHQAKAFFRDVTPSNFHPPSLKFGGPAIADLDGNGYPDLILPYHGGSPTEVYFNFAGEFVRSSFAAGGDMHASVPFRASPEDKGMHFTISRGGSRGNFPRSPSMFRVNPDTKEIVNVTDESGITSRKGRGRSALYVDLSLSNRSTPDVIYTNSNVNKCSSCTGSQNHVFKNVGGNRVKFRNRRVRALQASTASLGTVVDVDGDGVMETILFGPGLEVYKTIAPLRFRDITLSVLPRSMFRGVDNKLPHIVAIAEFDYDDDGDMDLYIALGKTNSRFNLNRGERCDDFLLENQGGVFVDVSARAGIPKGTFSFGVTTGDFDNDGFTDVYLTNYDERDIMLFNNGDGTFRQQKGLIRRKGPWGDMSQAVDYDADGRLDLIVGEGERQNELQPGRYRVMRNEIGGARRRGFVLVRVGSSPRRQAVSLHALVTVRSGRKTWIRRVGTPGIAISSSYIELIHVGIGDATGVSITVRWVNGEQESVFGVSRGSTVKMGTFGDDNNGNGNNGNGNNGFRRRSRRQGARG